MLCPLIYCSAFKLCDRFIFGSIGIFLIPNWVAIIYESLCRGWVDSFFGIGAGAFEGKRSPTSGSFWSVFEDFEAFWELVWVGLERPIFSSTEPFCLTISGLRVWRTIDKASDSFNPIRSILFIDKIWSETSRRPS